MIPVVVVDEQDVPIGVKDRDVLTKDDIYRVSALWITNSAGQVLLAQRSLTKKRRPGAWGSAVAGTIEEGEDYDDNIVKEIKEEIGLDVSIADLKRDAKIRTATDTNTYFAQWYTYVLDKPIEELVLQEEEVAQVKWFDPVELKEMIEKSPEMFTSAAPRWIGWFL